MNADSASVGDHGRRLWQAAAAALSAGLILALGWWAGEQSARHTDSELRAQLVHQATELAKSIDPELAAQITFTAADMGTAAFENIRAQMSVRARIMPLRGVYSMGLREGALFFGPESYPEGDPMASAPGAAYRRPSPAIFDAFRRRRAVAIGPVTDEFGTFVTAIAPVVDTLSPRVLMMVGMDVLAGDWQECLDAARRLPRVATVALLLLFCALALAASLSLRRALPRVLQVRRWIVVPTAMAGLFLLLSYGVREVYLLRQSTNREMERVVAQAQSRWNRNVAAQVRTMRRQIAELESIPALRRAWQQRDLPALTAALALPESAALKREYGIAQCTFAEPDRRVFLRAHRPDMRGERLDQGVLLTAERAGCETWGFELDRAGKISLRYVKPWQEGTPTNGYLVLGIEIHRLVQQLAADVKVEVAAFIPKQFVTRQAFEGQPRGLGFRSPWDSHAVFAVPHQTTPALPAEVSRWLDRHGRRPDIEGSVFPARQGAARYACGVLSLPDVSGRTVAHLVVMQDFTTEMEMAWSTLLLRIVMALVAVAGLLALLWAVSSHSERQLKRAFERVHASEARYRALFESLATGVVMAAPDGRLVESNPAARRILRMDQATIASRSSNSPEWIGIRPDGTPRPHEERAILRALRERRTVTDVVTGICLDNGVIVWISSNATPIFDAVGQLQGVVASFSDITAHKEDEDLLRLQHDLAIAVAAQPSPDEALQKLLEHVCRLPGVDCGGVYRVDGKTGRAELLAHRGLSDSFVAAVAHVAPDNFRAPLLLAGQPIYLTGEARIAGDVDGILAFEGLRTLVVIPQKIDGRIVAALNLGSHAVDDFPPATRAALEAIAAQTSGLVARLDAQRRIVLAKEEWERTFDAVPDLIALLDKDFRITNVNRSMAERLGCTPEQAVGRQCYSSVHGLNSPPDFCPHARMLASNHLERAEVMEPALGGIFDVTVTPLRNAAGEIVGSVHVAHEITERKRAEQELRASEENFRRLADSAFDGIVIADARGLQVYANPRASQITGYSQEEALLCRQQDLIVPSEYEKVHQRMLDRLAGREAPPRYETLFRRKDGTVIPVEISATRTIWRGEQCVLVLFRDISDRKRMENEILQIGDWEKTRIGQDLHDTIGQQLVGMSYLIRALASSWKSQPQKETEGIMAHLVTEARNALDLVREVARGLTSVEPGPNGLADALHGVAERARQLHGVACDLQLAAAVTVADRQVATHLHHIVQEAVTNALRHGQARHIVVRLARTEGRGAELSIQDDGVGLPAAAPNGQGLGLHIMSYRADLIGGTLTIERGEGGGTRVALRFETA